MKLIRKHNELNLLKESDDFDWIKGVDISDYLEPPYFINMKEYGLPPNEYEKVLSKIYNQPVTIKNNSVYDTNSVYDDQDNKIYYERSGGYWYKSEYDGQGNEIHYEDELGYWEKYEYDGQGNIIYYEDSDGNWVKKEYDAQGNEIYYEDNDGYIEDNRNLNESDDLDWIRDVDPNTHMFYQVLNKAFEFDPPAENWDGLELEYNKLVDYLESLGFESGYATPRTIDGDDMAVGLYAYRKIKSGELKYVYTSGIDEDDEESYYQHILEFARDESEDRGKNLQVVDAREFVNNMIPIKEDFDISNGEKTISLNKKFFLDDYRDELVNESDDFDWIRDVEPNISFYDVKVNEKYNVELTDEFYKALNDCFGDLEPFELEGYKNTTNVRVIGKDMSKHTDVHCHSGNDSEVVSLHLTFYNDNDTNIADSFWVTEEMVNLFPRVTDLNESNEFDWIKDIDISDYLEPPYFKSMKEYGLSEKEYESTLSKVFNQPITIKDKVVYNNQNKIIYHEKNSRGDWEKYEYDADGNEIHYEDVNGHWYKKEYNDQGKNTYYENANGFWEKSEWDGQGNLIYRENSNGNIMDNRNINESDDFDWIKDVEAYKKIEPNTLYYFEPNLTEHEIDELINVIEPNDNEDSVYSRLVSISFDKGLKYFYTDDEGQFHTWDDVTKVGNSSYIGKNIINGRDYFGISDIKLNESDDFNWIKDIDIANHIEPPYFINMKEYGLSPNEYELVLSRVFNQPVTIKDDYVYDNQGNNIYYEDSTGFWVKSEYDTNGNNIYGENSSGDWYKYEYDNQGNRIYWEDSDGYIRDNR